MTKLVTRQAIVDNARTWVGVPYKHMGYNRKGVDCVGLLTGVALELQLIAQPPKLVYAQCPSVAYFTEQAYNNLNPVDRKASELVAGDVATFFASDSSGAQHFAIVGELYGGKTMIHALAKYKKVIEHAWPEFWDKRYVRAFEFRNVEALLWHK